MSVGLPVVARIRPLRCAASGSIEPSEFFAQAHQNCLSFAQALIRIRPFFAQELIRSNPPACGLPCGFEIRSSARVAPRSVSRDGRSPRPPTDTVPEGLHTPGAGAGTDGAEPHGFLDDGFVLARRRPGLSGTASSMPSRSNTLRWCSRSTASSTSCSCRTRYRTRSNWRTARDTRMCSPRVVATVVQVPQFGPLHLRVPLAELVAEAEHPLLARAFSSSRRSRRTRR